MLLFLICQFFSCLQILLSRDQYRLAASDGFAKDGKVKKCLFDGILEHWGLLDSNFIKILIFFSCLRRRFQINFSFPFGILFLISCAHCLRRNINRPICLLGRLKTQPTWMLLVLIFSTAYGKLWLNLCIRIFPPNLGVGKCFKLTKLNYYSGLSL